MSDTVLLLPPGMQQFSDANGAPYVGGTINFYIPNTSTPKDTWQDEGQSILNTNPVILDSAGRATIWGAGDYRMVLKDSLGNLIYDKNTTGLLATTTTSQTVVIEATIDGGVGVPGTGIFADVYVPFACTITAAVLQATLSGSIVVDVWAATFVAGSPPTVANSIVASDPPTLSSAQGSIDTTLTGWVTAISAGTWIRFNCNSVSTLHHATLNLVATITV